MSTDNNRKDREPDEFWTWSKAAILGAFIAGLNSVGTTVVPNLLMVDKVYRLDTEAQSEETCINGGKLKARFINTDSNDGNHPIHPNEIVSRKTIQQSPPIIEIYIDGKKHTNRGGKSSALIDPDRFSLTCENQQWLWEFIWAEVKAFF